MAVLLLLVAQQGTRASRGVVLVSLADEAKILHAGGKSFREGCDVRLEVGAGVLVRLELRLADLLDVVLVRDDVLERGGEWGEAANGGTR